MEEKQMEYDKETAEIFNDPYRYAVDLHIKNIRSDANTVEIKKEYILGLETILVKQDISTAISIFARIGECVDLIDVQEVEEDVCGMLGFISQNVEPVAREMVRCRVVEKAIALYKRKPEAVDAIILLFTILNNTLNGLQEAVKAEGQDPSIIKEISTESEHMSSKSKSRLAVILGSTA
ncbi:hypothetical protein NEAUS04_0520 [Nematocida ausubeli]|uniref:Uncharacterized protein n=1 Tax=Nematocida ausubeli (strain ATCC PRA-371 / ERTm2) TaxID=1913371 RepID=A0A086IZ55_NEMA1|nr:uncharacterized protein NESG_02393 [Nematocida ausubeli]KAI5134161.1 hypothetical protein NEAUS07_0735 [Nematocida ausubeli]KAI5147345.1 hypothetical protein NEAUS05_0656 [Nematocida ausubeli]KAI5161430.1 hypothetical protein NEAUS04_0520 [Nematocida ausubeli]KFG25173.1 hypothetical protein NESG_02393 [Nematocida ausubeli]